MRNAAITLGLATALAMAATAPSLARGGGFGGGGQQAWGAGVGQNPEDFPQCMIWSGKDRTYVWICGKPYPAGMPHN